MGPRKYSRSKTRMPSKCNRAETPGYTCEGCRAIPLEGTDGHDRVCLLTLRSAPHIRKKKQGTISSY